MPCHADRVRRNYHDVIGYLEPAKPWRWDHVLTVTITQAAIANAMSKEEMRRHVLRLVDMALVREAYESM